MEIERWVRLARGGYTGTKVDMITGVEEVGLVARLGRFHPFRVEYFGFWGYLRKKWANIGHYTHALPFSRTKKGFPLVFPIITQRGLYRV